MSELPQAFVDSISAGIGELLAQSDDGLKVPAVTATVEFALEPEHLSKYAEAHGNLPAQKSDEKDINVLRARHHAVARYLASGLGEGIVAELTNFSKPYISTLKNNPSMAQLIAHYSSPGASAVALAQERLRTAADGALERLMAKLEEGKLTSQEELQLAKLGYDRSNVGPSASIKAESIHTDVAEVARLHLDARRRDNERIMPVDTARKMLAPPKDQSDAA